MVNQLSPRTSPPTKKSARCNIYTYRIHSNIYYVIYFANFGLYNTHTLLFLYFVDRASRYKFLLITNLTHLFMYLFISPLYMFRASQCSSSRDRNVLIHHLVRLVCVSDCLVYRSGIPSSHLHRLIIPDDVLIQFDLLMMST